jgi:hypothetical protein
MRDSSGQVENRREFFRSGVRYSLLAGVSAVAALLGRRRLAGQRCVNRGICGGCAVFEACGLPQALSVKQAKERGLI